MTLAVLLLAAPQSAEEWLHHLEQSAVEARTLAVQIYIIDEDPGTEPNVIWESHLTQDLMLGEGERIWEQQSDPMWTRQIVCDGRGMTDRLVEDDGRLGEGATVAAALGLRERCARCWAVVGSKAHWMLTGVVFDPSRLGAGTYEVSDLQFYGQETIDGGPAVIVEYDLNYRTADTQDRVTAHVRLWIHETEFRPLRRVLQSGGDRPWTRTETYSRWELNAEVAESRFALP